MSKKIMVTQSSMPPLEDYVHEIADLWESHWLTNQGKKHQELQKQLEKTLSVEHVSLFTNGHLALEAVIEALEWQKEVITTPFTFASTTHALVRRGIKPIFCDVKATDGTIDPSKIEACITKNTVGILPVHVYGQLCDVVEIERIAKKHQLQVVYDAAHAFYQTLDGVGVGNFGDASMFSFHATKTFNTIEGGAITTAHADVAARCELIKNFGISDPETIEWAGTNAKMNEFQAAMGLCNLRTLPAEIAKREKIYQHYIQRLSSIDGIRLLTCQSNITYNYAYMPVFFEDFYKTRDQVVEQLKAHHIFARKYFYPLITDFDCYKHQYDSSLTPIAKTMAQQVCTLPIYADLPLSEVDRICDVILSKEGIL